MLHADNRLAWSEAASHYATEHDARVAGLRAGTSHLHPLERTNIDRLDRLGQLAEWCRRAVHLQCASGEGTLSLLLNGAGEVIGIDIGDLSIENARRTLEAVSTDPASQFTGRAVFHRCDLLDVAPAHPELLGTADIVFTVRSSIFRLHDLAAWAIPLRRSEPIFVILVGTRLP